MEKDVSYYIAVKTKIKPNHSPKKGKMKGRAPEPDFGGVML